ncbi:MAG: DNA damage-inducible protein D [Candidatus Adiutrix sp.]|jgi:DNA-damage-inducible protein D|nr:DNA damage-inducible protein D [Candidatus Adiutrix sp.]
MTEDQIAAQHHKTFEEIRHVDESGVEYWLARDLSKVLDYSEFRHFIPVVNKAVESCLNSGQPSHDHFEQVLVMIKLGKTAEREVGDIKLSRYACYLIVQNADPTKPVIALGQTYFAIQTRRQELADAQGLLLKDEDQLRLKLRNDIKYHNKELASAAKGAGVETKFDYAIFQDEGYKGLYGGRGQKDIHRIKGLKKSQKILDHMGSTELAANLFRATQTADVLKKNQIKDKVAANETHHEVGRKVRKAISDIGGTMPENLETPEKSIGQLETAKKKLPK